MKYAHLPLLQVCAAFLLGSAIGFLNFPYDDSTHFLVWIACFIAFLSSFILARRLPQTKLIFSFLCLIFLFYIGVMNSVIHQPEHSKTHYIHLAEEDSLDNSLVSFQGRIQKPLPSSAYYDKFEVELQQLNQKKVEGKILLQVSLDSNHNLKSNSIIKGYGKLNPFTNPRNPQQFNYKDYMWAQEMHYAIQAAYPSLKIVETSSFSFTALGEDVRAQIKQSLEEHVFSQPQLELMQALLLGQKQDIDKETYNQFSKAGVVHILAVSGLHVGIILLILQFLTQGILRLQHGKIIRSIVVILGIWGFALLAGFSPSVLRAAVMFSFLSLALNFRRKTSAINTLFLSAVLLVIINPYYLYQVGFQLSYLAVISIVILQPQVSKLYEPRFYIDRKIWDIISVTITAQLGVLPLSLYYFHQFPGLFVISNLIILPFLGLLLGFGLVVIGLSLIGFLPDIISSTYGFLLQLLLMFVAWIASQDNLIFSDIYFTKPMLIASLILLFSILLWDSKQKARSFVVLNVSLIVFFIMIYVEKQSQIQQKEVVIFQSYATSHLGVLEGSVLRLFSDEPMDKDSIIKTHHIKNYIQLKGVTTTKLLEFKNSYALDGTRHLFVLDSFSVYPRPNFHPDYLLLKNSPNINLDRALKDLQPQCIIADGSNYKSDINRWSASAQQNKIPFHNTWEKGAFVISNNYLNINCRRFLQN